MVRATLLRQGEYGSEQMYLSRMRCMPAKRLWAHVGPVGLYQKAILEIKFIGAARVSEGTQVVLLNELVQRHLLSTCVVATTSCPMQ